MRSVARFIVKHRNLIAVLFVILAAISGIATLQVKVNRDMTQYLPVNMPVKQGMDVMSQEFGESTSIQVMAKDVPVEERADLGSDLANLTLVGSVTYEEDDPHYNQDEYALYEISLDGNSYSDSAQNAVNAIDSALSARNYEHWIAGDIGNTANSLGGVYAIGISLAMVILFTLATSWIEPLLLLITIVIAVLINMGTCVFMPSVSDTTFSIGGILQMVLSMDYLIMLMNLYRSERETQPPEIAMENSLARGVSTIASSSVTTVAGLLCLVFMSFTIGADLGIVLAKGVIISLICVFAVQPALAIAMDKLLTLTAKPYPQPKMIALSNLAFKLRYPLLIVFLALFAVGYSMRGVTQIDFISHNDTEGTPVVREVFPEKQQIVVLYDNQNSSKAVALMTQLAQNPDVINVSSYESTVGKQKSAAEMADQMGMDASLVAMLYYYRFHDGDLGQLDSSQFASYLRTDIQQDLGNVLDDDSMKSVSSLANLVDQVSPGVYSPKALTDAIGKHSVTEDTVRLMYLAYRGSHDADTDWTMSLDQLTDYLVNVLMEDSTFDAFFDDKVKAQLTDAREQVESGIESLKGPQHSRLIASVYGASDSEKIDSFVTSLRTQCDEVFGQGSYFLVGEGPMVQDMAASFSDEFNFISLLTIIAILIIVLVTFRSASIPVILVAIIQCAFCWDMILNYFLGNSIFYLALLVVQSILMGATIDYAILFTENYRFARKTMGKKDSVRDAYVNSIRTILMSGSILVLVTGALGILATGLTAKICLIISEGALIAVIMVLFILPGTIMALDRLVVSKKNRIQP